jgi:hypothetical protein
MPIKAGSVVGDKITRGKAHCRSCLALESELLVAKQATTFRSPLPVKELGGENQWKMRGRPLPDGGASTGDWIRRVNPRL